MRRVVRENRYIVLFVLFLPDERIYGEGGFAKLATYLYFLTTL